MALRNVDFFSDKNEKKEKYRSTLGLYLIGGVFVYLYSIPNIFFVYIDDFWRLFAVLLFLSYFVMSAVASYIVVYRRPNYEPLETNLLFFTNCLWSMVAINLYGIQALVDQPFYQDLYINLLWTQLLLIIFSSIKWIPVRTRERVASIITIILGAFFMFHLLGVFNSTKGSGIYVFLFGEDAAVALIWPGVAFFFSLFWTRVIMGGFIDLDITPEERVRRMAEAKAREEASVQKVSEEMLSSGRYLEYGELEYPDGGYREKGSKTFEDVEFLYTENGVRHFSRIDLNPSKEMILYKEHGQWYCQTSGQEPEPVLLPEWTIQREEELHEFEDDKRAYLKRAIRERLEVPHFVELPDDIDESRIDRYE